ncbi:MAG: hypothetical protein ACM3X1_03710 [Ignavibacteriales bacterium]
MQRCLPLTAGYGHLYPTSVSEYSHSYHDYYGRLTEEQVWALRFSNSWQIIPVNFQKRHREMLQWTYTLLSKRFIKIHPSLQQLIVRFELQ